MWRFAIIGFLVAHGLVHLLMWVWVPKPKDGSKAPFDPGYSWLLGAQESPAKLGALAAATMLILAGIGLWAHVGWWRPAAALGLALSLGLMILYFHPPFLFIQAVNAALIIGIVWFTWPSRAMVGA